MPPDLTFASQQAQIYAGLYPTACFSAGYQPGDQSKKLASILSFIEKSPTNKVPNPAFVGTLNDNEKACLLSEGNAAYVMYVKENAHIFCEPNQSKPEKSPLAQPGVVSSSAPKGALTPIKLDRHEPTLWSSIKFVSSLVGSVLLPVSVGSMYSLSNIKGRLSDAKDQVYSGRGVQQSPVSSRLSHGVAASAVAAAATARLPLLMIP